MADQQAHATATDVIDNESGVTESNAEIGNVPTLDTEPDKQTRMEGSRHPSHFDIIEGLKISTAENALDSVSQISDIPPQPDHTQAATPVKTAGNDTIPALDAGISIPSTVEKKPSNGSIQSKENVPVDSPAAVAPVALHPSTDNNRAMAVEETKLASQVVDHNLPSSELESLTGAHMGEPLQDDKMSNHDLPVSTSFPIENISVPHDSSSVLHSSSVPVIPSESVIEPKETDTTVPPQNDISHVNDLAPSSHESSRTQLEGDVSIAHAEPILEALPQSEKSVAENPSSAIADINKAAAELDHLMEGSDPDTKHEFANPSFNKDLESLAHVPPEAVYGIQDTIQQHDETHMPFKTTSKTYDPTPQHDEPIMEAVDDVSLVADPVSVPQVPLETHAPLEVHEPLEPTLEAATPSGSTTADTEMDDGSSVSTIQAYLGTHAASIGTGSVNGDSIMDDGDSALGDDVESITESLSASMLEYRYENGRRYHAFEDGKYHLPNDEKEADRLDFQHHIWLLTLNGELHRAPLSSTIQTVLDVGTGTGIWAIDFANAFPNARVIGTDLSPIQPSWVPPNLSFMVDDAEAFQDWEFQQKFDYIHSRLVILSMRDWPRYLRRCFANLKPGGWIELQEVQFPFQYDDNFPPNDSPLLKWSGYVREATSRVGVDTMAGTKFVDMLQTEGFVNINRDEFRWGIGSWSKDPKEREIGKWMVYNALEGVESAGMALFSRVFGWSKDEIEVFLESVRKDIRNKAPRYYAPISVTFAQKPFEAGGEE